VTNPDVIEGSWDEPWYRVRTDRFVASFLLPARHRRLRVHPATARRRL